MFYASGTPSCGILSGASDLSIPKNYKYLKNSQLHVESIGGIGDLFFGKFRHQDSHLFREGKGDWIPSDTFRHLRSNSQFIFVSARISHSPCRYRHRTRSQLALEYMGRGTMLLMLAGHRILCAPGNVPSCFEGGMRDNRRGRLRRDAISMPLD